MTTSAEPYAPAYSFSNDDPEAVDRHSHLSAVLDGFTFSRLTAARDLTGLRCLEVGAGGGSVARWLVDQVGPTGRVLATDLNIRHIATDQGYEVRQHDLVTEPVPDGPWDLIHVRLVLLHLPQRVEILNRLAAALAPGGALVVEEWATHFDHMVLAAPDEESGALVEAYQSTMAGRILPRNGNDPTWADKVNAAMIAAGLVDVETTIHARSWPGGTPGALLIRANIAQLRDHFLAEGFSEADLDRINALVGDPRLVIRGQFTYSTTGYQRGGQP